MIGSKRPSQMLYIFILETGLPFASVAFLIFPAMSLTLGHSSLGMSISASLEGSMLTTFWLENMIDAIASGSLLRSILGEISSLIASFMISVMRFVICS